MLNVKTLAALGLSVALASTLVAPVMATPLVNGKNTNRNNNSQGQGQAQGQGQLQGQQQGQGQGQGQAQNSTNLNGNRNNNANFSGSSSRSGAAAGAVSGSNSDARNNTRVNSSNTNGAVSGSNSGATGGNSNSNATGGQAGNSAAGASTDGSVVNDIGATSNSATNQGGSLSNTVEGDEFTTIILPDPVQLSPAQNTQPGMEASCADLAIRADYTGGQTTGLTLYVLSFYGQNTPSDLPTEMQEGFQSVVVCGLSNQLLRIVHNADLGEDIKSAAQRLVIDQIFYNLYETNGMEYNPRALDLESVNLTPPVTLPLLK